MFAQGNVTNASQIPTSGTATYSVDGVLIANGNVSTHDNVELTANFADKTVSGRVATSVRVSDAKISGNEFVGTAVYNGKSAPLEGHFYGTNAAEIGGTYGSADFAGAFGGKKR